MISANRILRRTGAFQAVVIVSLAMVAVACSYQTSGSYRSSGAVTGSGSVEFTAAGVDWDSGEPAIVFGVTTLPGSREYGYIIVAKPDESSSGRFNTAASGAAVLEARDYSATHMIELGPSALSIVHTAKINGSQDGITDEKLMIQDKEVDLSLGRLILIDEWVIRGGWTQLATPLPGVTCAHEDLPEATRTALEALARSDSDLARFLRR